MKWYHYAIAVLVLAGGGYAAGRFSAPDRVQVRETVKTVRDETAAKRVQDLSAELETLKRDSHREVTVITRPDGTRERHAVVDLRTDRERQTETVKTQTQIVHDVQTVTRETVRTVERSRPSWRAGPIVVLDPGSLTVSYGAEIQRRIVGPLSVGVFGFGRPGAWYLGGGLSLEF